VGDVNQMAAIKEKRQDPRHDELGEGDQDTLIDSFGRVARKLRISLTDRCNMRCIYCMPQGNVQWFSEEDVLNFDEIVRLVSILTDLGIDKIRLTGGEPLLRPKLEDLISSLKMIRAVKSISMTTNGLLLVDKAKELKEAGLESVNISLDSFRASKFEALTGSNGLKKVMDSIDVADRLGLKVKINTVIIRGWNEDEITDFAEFARKSGHMVRFIEFMPLDGSGIWRPDLVFAKKEIIEIIERHVGQILPLDDARNQDKENIIHEADPAKPYIFADGKGTIGFIPSITEPFCSNCDRMRLTSDGKLLTCLFEKPGFDLRKLVRRGESEREIRRQLLESVKKKPQGIISIIQKNNLRPSLGMMHTIGG
jgi:GTP 3',8-cyclase